MLTVYISKAQPGHLKVFNWYIIKDNNGAEDFMGVAEVNKGFYKAIRQPLKIDGWDPKVG